MSGEFLLVAEVVGFGRGGVKPLKHRIRDPTTLEEERSFVVAGALAREEASATSAR